MERFDARTLWYDAFTDPSEEITVIICPPLLNLTQRLCDTEGDFRSGHRILTGTKMCMDRCAEFWIDSAGIDPKTIFLQGNNYTLPVFSSPVHCDWFADKRVLMTMSKNNELHWIKDCVLLNVQGHGANGVLFYDNGSSNCTAGELLETIGSVKGVDVAVVVIWPFPYGPTGGPWDSDFCQYGRIQHARGRFLSSARSVLNVDIDEWVLPLKGRSVFEICEESPQGYVLFHGSWCYTQPGNDIESIEHVRHADHRYYLPADSTLCPGKWAVVPQNIPVNAQWRVHDILNGPHPRCHLGLSFRHFWQISTSWKYRRGRRPSDEGNLQFGIDRDLENALHNVVL